MLALGSTYGIYSEGEFSELSDQSTKGLFSFKYRREEYKESGE